jgi:hypothetical protein
MIRLRWLFVTSWFALATQCCLAQWTKTIDCPVGTVYNDVRPDAGRSEYCVRTLPGGLEVKDGPSRFWFNPDFEGGAGSYSNGRERGRWKECDRFHRCEQKNYPLLYPEEQRRPGIKDEIPITFADGKYRFDFASCRGTRITYTENGKPALELNVNTSADGCLYAYHPEGQAAATPGSENGHVCIIPFSLGKRSFDSLDLMAELPELRLPQYCKSDAPITGPIGSDVEPAFQTGSAQIFTATYDTGNNGVGITQARLHFQRNAASRSDRCVVSYDPGSKSFLLLSDEPGKVLGPIHSEEPPVWNKECLLSACSTAELTGTTLTVHFAIRFNRLQFSGPHHMYLELVDGNKHVSPAGDSGQWIVPPDTNDATKPWPSDKSCPAILPPPH